MSDGGEEGMTLEYTPTWVVAGVCTVIVAISFLVLSLLRVLGRFLLKNDKKSLFEALQKVKGELLLLLLAVGTKLEHVIGETAEDVAERHAVIEGDLAVRPSDEFFWFNRPYIVLLLIHFILFQNAFEIAFLFWVWIQYGFGSCIMGNVRFIVPRLIIGVFIQVVSSYSTLPFYAIVTQMGSKPKKAIIDEQVRESLIGWARATKRKAQSYAAYRSEQELLKTLVGRSGQQPCCIR